MTKLSTRFAPPERASEDTVRRQTQLLLKDLRFQQLYDAVSEVVVILNKERQIVFYNRNLVELLGPERLNGLYGLRPGEALGCMHAFETEGGCGTTEFCSECGAVNAILKSHVGQTVVKECMILRGEDGNAFNFLVRATPLAMQGEAFTIFAVTDISHEKRRTALERIFFHDIMNTALSLRLLAQLLIAQDFDPSDEIESRISIVANTLVEEINCQRDLMAAEKDDLSLCTARVGSLSLLKGVANLHEQYGILKRCEFKIDANAQDVQFKSDATLLSRVLGNMIKNAIEASGAGQPVTLGCQSDSGGVKFWVHNRGFIPREVQLQIFQRSFTTKGAGRGLGTYCMKLLSERYLKGRVFFSSSEVAGTTFTAWYPSVIHGE